MISQELKNNKTIALKLLPNSTISSHPTDFITVRQRIAIVIYFTDCC